MKKLSITSLAALAAWQLMATSAVGRHIKLEEATKPAGLVRFLSQALTLADGAKQSWVTLTRTGDFSDPRYGNFSITLSMLQQMVRNFDAHVAGQDIFLDVAHKHSDGAAAKLLKLAIEPTTGQGNKLRALVEWTPFGMDAVRNRGFAYLSAEYHEAWTDPETTKAHGCVLLAAGLTTRPVIKHLDPIQLSIDDADHDAPARVAISPQLLKELQDLNVNYLDQLKAKYKAMGLSDDVSTKLLAEAKKQFDAVASDQVKSLALVDQWAASGQTVADHLKTLGTGNPQQVSITLAAPGSVPDVAELVNKALAVRETANATAAAGVSKLLKLLSDTIAEDKTISAEDVKTLADEMAPQITAMSTEDQVKSLAAIQQRNAQRFSAATKLASLGYLPIGDARISVDSTNIVKSLQATIDRRLGYEGMSDADRYKATGGKLLPINKAFAEKALAQFDAEHGSRLALEHKMLAGGTGSISDVAVPAVAERTVLRESLYALTSLNLVNVGTAPFAQVLTIPYSYRDTAAAGVEALRRFEGQGIRRAGVIQTQEEARPIPQKLAYLLSSEMKLLMSASVIDFDPAAENVRNIIRIVGEDTEALNMNELVFSADEAGITVLNDTLTGQVNGTNSVFVTSKFPVVRPRVVYDLKGQPVGNPANPLVITLNGLTRAQYALNADGSALSAGIYWTMDWNLGELRFVDQTGAVVVPTNGWALTVVGSASTNRATWDSDVVNGESTKQRYDRLLTMMGSRKVVIENDRYYTANLVAMSGALDNAVSQAESFQANAKREGTSLSADGSVGFTKGMPTFNPTAPGLVMGDNRILIGERGNTRFRMLKAFAMNPPEQVRNSAGLFTDQQEGFGTQFVVSHTPRQLKNSLTSVIVYSGAGRVARA